MSSEKSYISDRREALWKREKELLSQIEQESSELEKKMEKALKTSLVIGSGVLIGYALYKGIAGEQVSGKKKKKVEKVKRVPDHPIRQSGLRQQIFSEILKRGVTYLLSNLANKPDNTERDQQP